MLSEMQWLLTYAILWVIYVSYPTHASNTDILFINCSLVGIGVKMILRDSAYSAVFSCFKSISSSKSIKNFSPWVPRSEKLHFFQGTIFKVTEKITPPKMVAELVSLLPRNLETGDRNAGGATKLFFSFLFPLFSNSKWNLNIEIEQKATLIFYIHSTLR